MKNISRGDGIKDLRLSLWSDFKSLESLRCDSGRPPFVPERDLRFGLKQETMLDKRLGESLDRSDGPSLLPFKGQGQTDDPSADRIRLGQPREIREVFFESFTNKDR